MSGFLGVIGEGVGISSPLTRAAAAGHADQRVITSVFHADWCTLAVKLRSSEHFSIARDEERGITIALLGLAVSVKGPAPKLVNADELVRCLDERAEPPLYDLEGSYQIAVVEERDRRCTIFADHLASRPLYFAEPEGCMVIGTSGSDVLVLGGIAPDLALEGVAGFLAVGYPLGQHTLLKGVSRLQPGRALVYEGAAKKVMQRTWWDLSFEDPISMTLGEAADQLHQSVLDAHRLTLLDRPSTLHLALTGGHDSRLILGALRELGELPDGTFTWAATEGVEGSDPDIAARLAVVAKVPHKTLIYAPVDLVENLEDWTLRTELMSDNLGHFAAGSDFLPRHGIHNGVVLLGDQVFGLGQMFASRNAAMASVLRLPWPDLGASLRSILPARSVETIREIVSQQLEEILTGCDSKHPKDMHHYLYYHVGVFGWLLAPGYYKEPLFEARRPLMTRGLVSAVSRWPRRLRVDKVVMIEVLRRHYSDLHAIPTAHASALVDWAAAIRTEQAIMAVLRRLLSGNHFAGNHLGEVIELNKARLVFTGLVNNETPSAQVRNPKLERLFNLRRMIGGTRTGAPLLRLGERLTKRWLRSSEPGPSRARTLFRVVLLAQLFDHYANSSRRNVVGG